MYFVTDIKLVDMRSNSYRHLDSYNNKAKLRGDLLLSLYDDKSDTITSMTVAYKELNYFFRNAFKRYKILLPSKGFISITKHIALLPLLDYIDDHIGVVHDIPYFSFDLDRFDYISEDCCFLRVLNKKSDWRSIMDILATGKYYRYNDKVYIYMSDNKWYCYRITDVDKFDLLYTKLQVFKKEG